jgi:anhydro-N-acetylmuramic acid kinase
MKPLRVRRAGGTTAPDIQTMTVAGVMSGTSADGIDVALVRIAPSRLLGNPELPKVRLLAHAAVPYPAAVRKRVLEAMNGENESVRELSRLHWRLGELYAKAIETALKRHPMRIDLVGCHGQTIYHQAAASRTSGHSIGCTWQMGEASVIASRLGVPVVSDFRPTDIAVGGQGAPLVPLFDFAMFRHATRNRVLQNLGGIGNLTAIPAGASAGDVLAFDTGPANMVIDALTSECFRKPYDRGGAIAARGRILDSVLRESLALRFFSASPPKSAGREQFGREFAAQFLAKCRRLSRQPEDAIATATALTARSIGIAWKRFVQPALVNAPTDCILAGGGAKNPTLMRMIQEEVTRSGEVAFLASEDFGIPAAAKEAMAFALLAWRTWHGLPGNLPAATGARKAVVLGKIAYA